MNRFEALHALGLEENASEEDVRLAYYGLEKAVGAFDFSDSERIDQRVKGMVEHAKESRNFLLSVRNQTVARKVRSFATKQRGKLSVTPVEEKTARLHGLEQLRGVIVSYHSEERSKRRGSIIALLACIVVGFIGIRYLRLTAGGADSDPDAPEPDALEPDSYEVDDPDDFDGDRTARKGARA